jgi:alpha-galactosidase/6-phospho-beta-glucosidase family protein
MKQLLNQATNLSEASSEAALSGKIMHIKTYVERDPQTRRIIDAQIRCYFAYKTTTSSNRNGGAAF